MKKFNCILTLIVALLVSMTSCSYEMENKEPLDNRISLYNLYSGSDVYWQLIKAGSSKSGSYNILKADGSVTISTDENVEYILYCYGETGRYVKVSGSTASEIVSVTPETETYITTSVPLNTVHFEIVGNELKVRLRQSTQP